MLNDCPSTEGKTAQTQKARSRAQVKVFFIRNSSLPFADASIIISAHKMDKATSLMMRNSLFKSRKPIIGMIHLGALPGTPAHQQSIAALIAVAVREAIIYRDCGVDGILIENMHDVPYLRATVGPEIVAAMTVIGQAV